MTGGEDAWCGWVGRYPKWGICVVRLVLVLCCRWWAGGGPILLPALQPSKTPHPLSSYSPPNKMPWHPLSGAAPRHPATEPDPPIPSTVHSSEGGPVLTLLADLAGCWRPRVVLIEQPRGDAVLPCCCLLTNQASLPRCLLPRFTVRSATGFNRGVPVHCCAATRVARRSHSRELQRPAMDNPYLRGV